MTVIAYREGVMAADSMSIMDQHVKLLDDVKIGKHKGHLYALAGENCPTLRDFRAWWFPDLGKSRRAPFRGNFKFDAIVVTPAGEIQQWDQRGVYEVLALPFYSIGSGKEYAIGAMEMGASAPDAVAVSIKWCPTVGGRVMTRKLHAR